MDKEDIKLLEESIGDVSKALKGDLSGISEIVHIDENSRVRHSVKVRKLSDDDFNKETTRRIRITLHMDQDNFANFMGVSVNTVKAWERGRNKPSGSSLRLLSLINHHPRLAKTM
ncbi:type II toxin-antitoxin system MqsA family antitoxin [Oenococcus sicerae]|uniref:Helix-turn-helix domain-containing protein n=1 Tax=Oenococcus sicerae TaxID=2203724 RepID=A0AAJ1RCE5_9LACO|nr:type II toxin-antitoxin system MqsA family antitoxin [Oenococcus sicerae]MDN6900375.1 helix-turn-helix domain-containing protein [Oenococcus sicerae]QAS69950.1 type II toxin-antitoxin system MqsA family antitoxin [Oenococcus sicerae]